MKTELNYETLKKEYIAKKKELDKQLRKNLGKKITNK